MPLQYYLTLFTCGVSTILLALVLSGVSIRHDEAMRKYCAARWCLCAAFLAFGIANLLQVGIEYDGKAEALTGVLAIVIGSFNAMMFSTVMHVFIRPSMVTKRNVMTQMAIILLLSAFLIVARFTLSLPYFYIVYGVFIGGYVLLLVIYTYIFVSNYQVFKKQMLDYYEEEEQLYRMRWIPWTFWSAAAVGLSALLLIIDNSGIDMLFTCLVTVYYLIISISFINYQQSAQLVIRSYEKPAKETEPVHEEENEMHQIDIEGLKCKISEWVKAKRFAETDKSVEETAQLLGTDSNTLRIYFSNYVGEDFRSWRNRLRIEEAKRLFDAKPTIKIIEVMNLTGFNDRPYFYRNFQKIAGVSVAEYRKKSVQEESKAKE